MLNYFETYAQSNDRKLNLLWFWKIARPVGLLILTPALLYLCGVMGAIYAGIVVRLVEAVSMVIALMSDMRKLNSQIGDPDAK